MDQLSIEEAGALLRSAQRLTVFTGAGASAESGIPTFRDGGFWDEFPPSQFANWAGLTSLIAKDPRRLTKFVHAVVGPIAEARPNAAHIAVASWQTQAEVEVITQNVDGLHQEAGSKIVHEVHGSLLSRVDHEGHPVEPISRQELGEIADRLASGPRTIFGFWRAVRPLMERRGLRLIRPSIVLFNEAMAEPDWSNAEQAAQTCDAMLTIGTSAKVYPAAMLPLSTLQRDRPVVTVDPNPPEAGYWVEGKASDIVPQLLSAKL